MGRIAIDGVQQLVDFGTGIRVYLVSLLKEFAAFKSEHKYIVYVQMEMLKKLHLPQADNIQYVPIKHISNPVIRVLWQFLALGTQLRRDHADILFSPSIYIPFNCPVPAVSTITDMAMYTYPNTHTFMQKLWYSMRLKSSAQHAAKILTISRTVASEISGYLGVNPDVIIPIHLSYDVEAYSTSTKNSQYSINTSATNFLLPEQYIFSSGGNYPRKNVAALIAAMEFIWARLPDLHLIIVGPTRFQNQTWEKSLALCSKPQNLHILGFVPDSALPGLYRSARLFVFPSQYEGFGIPILEAMASGTPVLCSDIPVFHEVAGDAAVFFTPTLPDEIAQKSLMVLEDADLREHLINSGLKRTNEFSWYSTAIKTLAVIENILNKIRMDES